MKTETIQGYCKKPWWIYGVAAGIATVPVLSLLQFGLQAGFSASLFKHFIESRFFLIETLWALSGAVAVTIVSRASFFYFVGLSFCTVAFEIQELRQGYLFGTALDGAMIAIWLAIGIFSTTRFMRTPYLNPRARWWTQDTRIRFVSRGTLDFRGVHFPIVTLDVSAGGAFVKLDERVLSGSLDGITGGEEVDADRRKSDPAGTVMLSSEQIERAKQELANYPNALGARVRVRIHALLDAAHAAAPPVWESEAEVVWISSSQSPHQFGMGLRFEGRSAKQRSWLRQRLRLLEQLGFEARASRERASR